MEKYCVPLEQAKKLKEIGFGIESMFYWLEFKDDVNLVSKASEDFRDIPYYTELLGYYPAYSVGELGEILKEKIGRRDCGVVYAESTWHAYHDRYTISALTEAQARGALLLYLLENKLLGAEFNGLSS